MAPPQIPDASPDEAHIKRAVLKEITNQRRIEKLEYRKEIDREKQNRRATESINNTDKEDRDAQRVGSRWLKNYNRAIKPTLALRDQLGLHAFFSEHLAKNARPDRNHLGIDAQKVIELWELRIHHDYAAEDARHDQLRKEREEKERESVKLSAWQEAVDTKGGANGIGAATVELFARCGALIVFGDLDATSGQNLASKHDSKRVRFLKTDVTIYEDNLALFRQALESYGTVDHAFSIAGIVEQGNIFDPLLSVNDVAKPPTNVVLDVNLLGPLYFARIAAAYLHHNKKPEDDKSIVLFSSVAGFLDSPGLFAYGASKHGVLGLMRCLRTYLPPTFGIRINAVAPLATATAMLPPAVQKGFEENGFPVNTPEQVADIVLGLVAGSHMPKGSAGVALGQDKEGDKCNGLTIYVEGGRGWDIEEGLNATRDEWMGKGPNERMMKAGAWLASGAAWTSDQ